MNLVYGYLTVVLFSTWSFKWISCKNFQTLSKFVLVSIWLNMVLIQILTWVWILPPWCHRLDILITYQFLFGITIVITMDKLFDTIIDFNHYVRKFHTFSWLKLIYGPQQHGLMFGSSYLNHLGMSFWLVSWYEHPLQSICILQHTPIYVWFYPCSYICNCLKMPKKSQINEYSDVS
jgi:hypothetical protein